MDKNKLKILLATTLIAAGAGMAIAQDTATTPDAEATEAGPMDFATLDADGSGEITVEDMEAMRANRFAEFDTNGDGNVTLEEFTAHAQAKAAERAGEMFGRLDADGDGNLSRDALEARMGRGGPGARMIDRFDTDNSGGVSQEEFDAAKERMTERRGMRGGHDGEKGGWHKFRN
ncbi:EF-hand domain-containing protein [Silicimonas algicola]|uniref:EF hand domain-containing protein n=1 Tax=Silicimonas algicola TaxID=1826607 RepID=A0A316G3Y5_9RHOB|nr:EF-hand domain-containing protein [Silicimonas algicola]PWK55035.1 EF hand domain-containing protein [Silicimonas algicola]